MSIDIIPIIPSFTGTSTGKRELLERKVFSSILRELFVWGNYWCVGINHENMIYNTITYVPTHIQNPGYKCVDCSIYISCGVKCEKKLIKIYQ